MPRGACGPRCVSHASAVHATHARTRTIGHLGRVSSLACRCVYPIEPTACAMLCATGCSSPVQGNPRCCQRGWCAEAACTLAAWHSTDCPGDTCSGRSSGRGFTALTNLGSDLSCLLFRLTSPMHVVLYAAFNATVFLQQVGKGKPVQAIVEAVINGSMMRVTLLPSLQSAMIQVRQARAHA